MYRKLFLFFFLIFIGCNKELDLSEKYHIEFESNAREKTKYKLYLVNALQDTLYQTTQTNFLFTEMKLLKGIRVRNNWSCELGEILLGDKLDSVSKEVTYGIQEIVNKICQFEKLKRGDEIKVLNLFCLFDNCRLKTNLDSTWLRCERLYSEKLRLIEFDTKMKRMNSVMGLDSCQLEKLIEINSDVLINKENVYYLSLSGCIFDGFDIKGKVYYKLSFIYDNNDQIIPHFECLNPLSLFQVLRM